MEGCFTVQEGLNEARDRRQWLHTFSAVTEALFPL